jgi:hypothetical protein
MTSRFLSRLLGAGATSLALVAAGSAHAATYEITFSGTIASGDIFATTTGSTVTGISGWVVDTDAGAGTFDITGLSPYASADQQFSPTFPFADYSGVSFSTAGGGDYNFASIGSSMYLVSQVGDPQGIEQVQGVTLINPTVTAVPEPGSITMMLAGALGLFGLTRRRGAH